MDATLSLPRLDEEGYLVEPAEWSESLAEYFAQQENIRDGLSIFLRFRTLRRFVDRHCHAGRVLAPVNGGEHAIRSEPAVHQPRRTVREHKPLPGTDVMGGKHDTFPSGPGATLRMSRLFLLLVALAHRAIHPHPLGLAEDQLPELSLARTEEGLSRVRVPATLFFSGVKTCCQPHALAP